MACCLCTQDCLFTRSYCGQSSKSVCKGDSPLYTQPAREAYTLGHLHHPVFRCDANSTTTLAGWPLSRRRRSERLEQPAEHRHAMFEEHVIVGMRAPEAFDELLHDR
jgi:hypothetical protein